MDQARSDQAVTMTRQWFAVFLITPLLWELEVGAVYHELSMEKFSSPPDLINGSLFGYSMAYQASSKKLITSAPKLGSGNVYECNIDTRKCDKIEVNDSKDNMWMGSTVATGHNFTMACAPRYTEHKTNYSKLGTFGRCYSTSSESNLTMVALPTVSYETLLDPYEKNMDSFGWSITVDKNDAVLVGGPAMNSGRVIVYKGNSHPKLVNNKLNVKFNFEFAKEIDSYIPALGYSVTSGNFLLVDSIAYAISSPYGTIGYGMVLVTDLSGYRSLPPPGRYQLTVGSLFGAALASASLRGPGQRQALLVGAPRYAERGQVDVGVVYIYQYDVARKEIVHQKTILGKKDSGQFGSAIISLGDLNGDGRDEIAVSAPYEDSGRGAVYIYSAKHLLSDVADNMLQSLQRIQPEGYRGFGLSLTALQDYDGNGCNELAIGAPQSDNFVLLRCMANFKVNVRKLEERKILNDTYFIFQLNTDFEFPEKLKTVKADIMLRVSITNKLAKLANADANNKFIEYKLTIRDKTPRIRNEVGIIIPKVIGYEPSIQYQITATQINSPATEAKFDPSHVLLSDLSVLNVFDTVWVADCAEIGKCKPIFDMSIQTTIQDGYTIGSSDIEYVSFSANNSGDVAYQACAQVDLRNVRVGRRPSSCSFIDEFLYCLPQQPVENNTVWRSEQIELDMKSLRSDVENITIEIRIYPHCTQKSYISSKQTLNLHPDYKGLIVKETSKDTIEITNEELSETGKSTSHVYTVYNNGMTVWVDLRCEIAIIRKNYYTNISVTVDSLSPYQCETFTMKNDMFTTTCIITELRKNRKFDVIIPIFIEPGTIEADDIENEDKKKITIASRMKLIYNNRQQEMRIVSTLKLKEAVVPIWIIVIASLVGLLIIVIIAFALYELGFLRRKNRDKLKQLRRSVHRQSVRRSMAVRESLNAAKRRSADREKLIEEKESGKEITNTDMPDMTTNHPKTDETSKTEEDLAIKDKEVSKKATEIKEHSDLLDKSSELQNNGSVLQSEDTEIPKKVVDKCKVIKNDQIIRGLQKNLVQNRSLTHLAITPKETKTDGPINTEI